MIVYFSFKEFNEYSLYCLTGELNIYFIHRVQTDLEIRVNIKTIEIEPAHKS